MEHKLIINMISFFIFFLLIIIFSNKLKFLIKFLKNIIVYTICIFIINIFLKDLNLSVGINEITSLFVGFFGIPGVVCLYILKIIL